MSRSFIISNNISRVVVKIKVNTGNKYFYHIKPSNMNIIQKFFYWLNHDNRPTGIYKKGFYGVEDKLITEDNLSNNKYILDCIVYYKPFIIIICNDGTRIEKYFETEEELNKYIDEEIKPKVGNIIYY